MQTQMTLNDQPVLFDDGEKADSWDSPTRQTSLTDDSTKEAKNAFKEMKKAMLDVGHELDQIAKEVGPDELEVEFSISFSAEKNLVIIKGSGSAGIKVKMAWKKPAAA